MTKEEKGEKWKFSPLRCYDVETNTEGALQMSVIRCIDHLNC